MHSHRESLRRGSKLVLPEITQLEVGENRARSLSPSPVKSREPFKAPITRRNSVTSSYSNLPKIHNNNHAKHLIFNQPAKQNSSSNHPLKTSNNKSSSIKSTHDVAISSSASPSVNKSTADDVFNLAISDDFKLVNVDELGATTDEEEYFSDDEADVLAFSMSERLKNSQRDSEKLKKRLKNEKVSKKPPRRSRHLLSPLIEVDNVQDVGGETYRRERTSSLPASIGSNKKHILTKRQNTRNKANANALTPLIISPGIKITITKSPRGPLKVDNPFSKKNRSVSLSDNKISPRRSSEPDSVPHRSLIKFQRSVTHDPGHEKPAFDLEQLCTISEEEHTAVENNNNLETSSFTPSSQNSNTGTFKRSGGHFKRTDSVQNKTSIDVIGKLDDGGIFKHKKKLMFHKMPSACANIPTPIYEEVEEIDSPFSLAPDAFKKNNSLLNNNDFSPEFLKIFQSS